MEKFWIARVRGLIEREAERSEPTMARLTRNSVVAAAARRASLAKWRHRHSWNIYNGRDSPPPPHTHPPQLTPRPFLHATLFFFFFISQFFTTKCWMVWIEIYYTFGSCAYENYLSELAGKCHIDFSFLLFAFVKFGSSGRLFDFSFEL